MEDREAKIHSLEAELSRLVVFLIKDVTQDGSYFEKSIEDCVSLTFRKLEFILTLFQFQI